MPEWIGKTIGKVRIEKFLARGGMAEVYLGTHLTLERLVAIKLLHSYVEEEPILLERFHREAKVVAGLRHPNIVQIFDFDTVDGHPYIVMEYLRGPTLAAYLRHLHQRKKRLAFDQVAGLLKGLTDALDYAHRQGVIHRDIKPGNSMLHSKTNEIPLDKPLTNDVQAILTDFGLVRVVNTVSQTASGFLSGTPAYMSPEQARGDQIDQRTDLYSLGVVLYELLAGRVPFEADNTVTILHMHIHTSPPPIPGLPAKIQAVLDRALAKNPADRYQTSQEMANDFYLSIGLTEQAESVSEPYPLTPLPIEIPPPTKPEALPKQQLQTEPPPKPEPRIEPVPSPKLQEQTALESSPKSQPQVESVPASKSPLQTALESTPKSQPQVESVPASKSPLQTALESTPKSQPQVVPAPAPKPARNRTWIGVALLSLICLALFAFGAWRLLPNFIQPTSTLTPVIPNTGVSPLPSEGPLLPESSGMVKIDAGTYEVGTSLFTDDYHIAPQQIPLISFWIDQNLITNAQYEQYMTESSAPPPLTWPGEGDHPVIGVTWEQALAYCQWANKRLPNEAEWEAAGRGPGTNPQLYPWGNESTADGQALNLPNENTYAVGSQSFNQSPLGVFDMVGNVWEWVGEPYADGQEGYKFLRGGRFGLPINDLAYRLAVAPGDTRYVKFASFRCAAEQVN